MHGTTAFTKSSPASTQTRRWPDTAEVQRSTEKEVVEGMWLLAASLNIWLSEISISQHALQIRAWLRLRPPLLLWPARPPRPAPHRPSTSHAHLVRRASHLGCRAWPSCGGSGCPSGWICWSSKDTWRACCRHGGACVPGGCTFGWKTCRTPAKK